MNYIDFFYKKQEVLIFSSKSQKSFAAIFDINKLEGIYLPKTSHKM